MPMEINSRSRFESGPASTLEAANRKAGQSPLSKQERAKRFNAIFPAFISGVFLYSAKAPPKTSGMLERRPGGKVFRFFPSESPKV